MRTDSTTFDNWLNPKGFPGDSDSEDSASSVGDLGLILELEGSPGGRHSSPLQYPCLENPMDRGAWQGQDRGPLSMGSQRDTTEQLTLSLFTLIPRAKWVTGREGPLLSPSAGQRMMESPPALRRNILFHWVCDGEVRVEHT